MYVSKIEVYAEFIGIGDALDPILMRNCPTWSKFEELDIKKVGDQGLIDLYKSNKKLCTIIVLGQGKSHGLVLVGKTKSDD